MEMPHAYPSPRAFGSELSFRRRYSVTAVLGLASEEDDDGQAAERELAKKKEYGASGAEMCREAFDKLSPEDKEHIKKIGANVVALIEEGRNQEAYAYLEKQLLDADEKPALWSLLTSKQRAAIKKTGEQLRKLEPAT
jgi:predicted Zn-dependent protease